MKRKPTLCLIPSLESTDRKNVIMKATSCVKVFYFYFILPKYLLVLTSFLWFTFLPEDWMRQLSVLDRFLWNLLLPLLPLVICSFHLVFTVMTSYNWAKCFLLKLLIKYEKLKWRDLFQSLQSYTYCCQGETAPVACGC